MPARPPRTSRANAPFSPRERRSGPARNTSGRSQINPARYDAAIQPARERPEPRRAPATSAATSSQVAMFAPSRSQRRATVDRAAASLPAPRDSRQRRQPDPNDFGPGDAGSANVATHALQRASSPPQQPLDDSSLSPARGNTSQPALRSDSRNAAWWETDSEDEQFLMAVHEADDDVIAGAASRSPSPGPGPQNFLEAYDDLSSKKMTRQALVHLMCPITLDTIENIRQPILVKTMSLWTLFSYPEFKQHWDVYGTNPVNRQPIGPDDVMRVDATEMD